MKAQICNYCNKVIRHKSKLVKLVNLNTSKIEVYCNRCVK